MVNLSKKSLGKMIIGGHSSLLIVRSLFQIILFVFVPQNYEGMRRAGFS